MRGEMKSRVAMSFPCLSCSPNCPRCSHYRIASEVGPVGDGQVHELSPPEPILVGGQRLNHDSFGTVRDQRRRALWCGLPSITSYITKQLAERQEIA